MDAMQEENKKKYNIVTGVPRSGTSLMMRILKMSGETILYDECKRPDKFNSYSYMEHSNMFKPNTYKNWIKENPNVWIKIINYYVQFIPVDLNYRFIYMYRNISESSASLQKYNGNRQTLNSIIKMNTKKHSFAIKFLDQLKCEYAVINYNKLMRAPIPELQKVQKLLNLSLNYGQICDILDYGNVS